MYVRIFDDNDNLFVSITPLSIRCTFINKIKIIKNNLKIYTPPHFQQLSDILKTNQVKAKKWPLQLMYKMNSYLIKYYIF